MRISGRWVRLAIVCLIGVGAVRGSEDQARANTYYTIYLQASNSNYVVAESGGGGAVNANRTAAGPWERFALIDLNDGSLQSGDYVYIQTNSFHYFNAPFAYDDNGDPYCTGALNAAATFPSTYQTFRIWKVGGSGTIGNSDSVAFESACGYYMVAENGGGSVVNANRWSIGGWETFTITM